VLLRAGADLNTTDHDGRTALIWAAKRGNSEVERVLLAAGADPNIVDLRGRTALDYATHDSFGWDRRWAGPRARRKAPGPPRRPEQRHIDPIMRFSLRRHHAESYSANASGDGIRNRAEIRMGFSATGPLVLTQEACGGLREGMSYSQVAALFGEEEMGGE